MLDAAMQVYDPREARAVAYVAMDDIYGVARTELALDPDREITPARQPEEVEAMIVAGMPVQYITGRAYFCGMEFGVESGVLIPRPETEELVHWAAAETPRGAAVLDIGTGSGAIAVALALAAAVGESRVCAVDISEEALAIARRNAERNGMQVEFSMADALQPAAEWAGEWRAESFDTVVSNPPYIPESERAEMHRNVTEYEPDGALFVPDGDPLLFYREVAANGMWLLRAGGLLFFEIHESMGQRVVELLQDAGYRSVELRQDINGRDRMVRAVKP